MFYIAEEDLSTVKEAVAYTMFVLNSGKERLDTGIQIGTNCPALKVTGYWVNDVMRIDIKVARR